MTPKEQISLEVRAARARYVQGTPENFPATTATVNLLALEAVLAELEQVEAKLGEANALLVRRSNDADNMLDLYTKAEARLAKVPALVEDHKRVLFLARHLFEMVPQAVWCDHGGDDMQGHFEGDYHAEQVREELKSLDARLAAWEQG